MLCGAIPADVLGDRLDWRTLSVAAEQRIDPQHVKAVKDPEVQRKIRHAAKEGIKMHDYPLDEPPSAELREKVDHRIEEWLKDRKNKAAKQVHLTDCHPWQDIEHRQYHAAIDQHGKVHCFIIMALLSPEHGWQVKFALDFPDATSGAIEMAILHALSFVGAKGCTDVTFGGGASNEFTPGHNLKGTRVKVLAKAYKSIATELHLTNKSEFRRRLGTEDVGLPFLRLIWRIYADTFCRTRYMSVIHLMVLDLLVCYLTPILGRPSC